MNKELQNLLRDINRKKDEVKDLIKEDRIEDAAVEKNELIRMQNKFDTLFDLDEKHEEQNKNNIINKLENNKSIDGKLICNAIYPCEKMKFKNKNEFSNMNVSENNIDISKLVRGMAGKGWTDGVLERDYFLNSMTAGGNKVAIPTPLAENILDLARTESAILGSIPIIPMESNNMSIVVQSKDAEAHFIAEEEMIPESDTVFTVAKLYGKTIAIFIPITEQLLDSTTNLAPQLENGCARAIANALDKALIYGEGDGTEGNKYIKGLASYDGINKVTHTGNLHYDFILRGIGAVKNNNINPTNVVFNTGVGTELTLLKDGNGNYINQPTILEKYKITESNNIKDNESLIFDRNSLVLGINKTITIEYGTYGDSFKKLMKGLRVHMRADLGVLRPKGIAISKVQVATKSKSK